LPKVKRRARRLRTVTIMAQLVKIEDFDNFQEVRDFSPASISDLLLNAVRNLDEREELEPFILAILSDPNQTPHGPMEIADILTHRASVKKESGIAAFILKGKSFPTVKPKDVSHQIYRLEKIDGLCFAVLAASGTVLDDAKEQFISTAKRLDCQYAIFDANDLARLFVAYGFLCPRDASRIAAGRCKCGYSPRRRILNVLQVESLKELGVAHGMRQSAGLVVLPTGGGKTRIAAEDAQNFGAHHILYVAHTHEILDVAESEFSAVFGLSQVTRHAAGSTFAKPNRVNITTIQLLRKHLTRIPRGGYDYLIVDEFHHAVAKSYRELIDKIAPSFLLGLTATPFRGDRQDILQLCGGNVLVNFELRTGIETGILCPYHYFGCFDDIDYSCIKHNGHPPSRREVDRNLLLGSYLYQLAFGSWKNFEKLVSEQSPGSVG
jgi:hypothetical protein